MDPKTLDSRGYHMNKDHYIIICWALLWKMLQNSEVKFLLFIYDRAHRNNTDVISFSTTNIFRELPNSNVENNKNLILNGDNREKRKIKERYLEYRK